MAGTRQMPVHRSLIPLALFVTATAAAWSCGDGSPVGVDLQTPALLAARSQSTGRVTTTSRFTLRNGKRAGVLACSQAYDSVTKVIGPAGGVLPVGSHYLFVNALALSKSVRITAVAPAGNARWVRFQPDGLVFRTNPVDGWGAALYTHYQDCGMSTSDTLRIVQVSDSLGVLEYLQTDVKSKKHPWRHANQHVAGLLSHFSNYAVAW